MHATKVRNVIRFALNLREMQNEVSRAICNLMEHKLVESDFISTTDAHPGAAAPP